MRRNAVLGGLAAAAAAALSAAASAPAATITVDVTNDEINGDADCSLREAVQAANTNGANTTGCTDGDANPALDTIALEPGEGYARTIPPDGTPNDNQDGDLDLNAFAGGPAAIEGGSIEGNTLATLFGGGVDRVLEHTGGTLTLTGVRITDGSLDAATATGAGISSNGTLNVIDSIVADNQNEQSNGGGIWSGGALTLQDAVVVETSAGGSGGAIYHGGGPLTIQGSTIAESEAGTEPGAIAERGGGVRTSADDVTILDSTFEGNGVGGSSAHGGALAMSISSTGTKTISGSTFTLNDAAQEGGAIFVALGSPTAPVEIDTTRIEDNEAGRAGGGIAVDFGDLSFDASVLRDNHVISSVDSVEGGGLALSGAGQSSAAITDSVVFSNSAETTGSVVARGGGIDVGDAMLSLRRSSVVLNFVNSTSAAQQRGGGIYVGPTSGSALVVNSTVSVNTTIDAGSLGGGIALQDGSVSVIHSTLSFNSAGGAADPGDALSEEEMAGMLVSGSVLDNTTEPEDLCASDGGGDLLSGGYNVAGGTGCGFAATGDEQGIDPLLGGTTGNGGLRAGPPDDTEAVQTNAVLPGSTVIGHVPVDVCEDEDAIPLATDARGFPRPAGKACEAGAYEVTKCFGEEVAANAIIGTEGADVLAGTGGADLIFSLAGADTSKGKGGADRICSTGGKDVLRGGAGPDQLHGGKGMDSCVGGSGVDKGVSCELKSGIP